MKRKIYPGMKTTKRMTSEQRGIAKGYRSGLESKVASQIAEVTGSNPEYETHTIRYTKPARKSRYKPDFILENNIIIETKGVFDAEDREKHLLIRDQHPELDIRFVFTRSKAPIYKGSKTTLADWCEKHGFLYADKLIPPEWFEEEEKPSIRQPEK